MMTFRQLQREHATWSAHNFGDQPSYLALLGAGEELGELFHAHLKCEQGIRGTFAEHELAKQDAVADVIIFLADYCTREYFDLQSAVEMAWAQVKQRDWKAYPQSGGRPPADAPPAPAAASLPTPDDNDDLVLPGRHIRVFYPCGCEASGPVPPPLYCPEHGKPEAPDGVLRKTVTLNHAGGSARRGGAR